VTVPGGWYPDPSGQPGQRYFNGHDWTQHYVPAQQAAPVGQTVVVTGPNHALHFILTLFTFWACGGWAWVWLIIAIANNRQVRVIQR
jgi:hypothetical protein